MTADPAFVAKVIAERRDLAERDPAGEFDDRSPLPSIYELKARGEWDPWPAPMAEAAYHGVIGGVVKAIEPHTEAAPEALLGTALVIFGALVDSGRVVHREAPQGANLYGVLVGPTNEGRKGTSLSNMFAVFDQVAEAGWRDILVPGIGSGEGLIKHLKRIEETDDRALLLETEFASALTRMGREGSTLSMTMRDAFDGFPLGRFLAREELIIHRHHVAFLGHVTEVELRHRLTAVDKENGFANRFLFLAVRSPRLVAHPVPVGTLIEPYVEPLHRAIAEARVPGIVPFSGQAEDWWDEAYPRLRARPPGVVGAIVARAVTHLIRLALVYALADRSPAIEVVHLEAGRAVTDYAERSARLVMGDSTGNAWADEILRSLRLSTPLSRSELRSELGFRDAAKLTEAITVLVNDKLAELAIERPGKGGGRVREWVSLR